MTNQLPHDYKDKETKKLYKPRKLKKKQMVPSLPFKKTHKRHRSTDVSDFLANKKNKSLHHRNSSSTSNRNTSLPTNRLLFNKNRSYKQNIPKGLGQNVNRSDYFRIPHNKYLRPQSKSIANTTIKNYEKSKMSTSTATGDINSNHGLLRKADDGSHFYETKLVTKIPGQEDAKGNHIPPRFQRSTIKIAMENENEWPSYTFSLHSLNYVNQATTHYNMNMGLRNKPIIELKKADTVFEYEVRSDQAWTCRQIVWCSTTGGPFNRYLTPHRGHPTSGEEYELCNFTGSLTQTGDRTCQFEWKEKVFMNAQDTMAMENTKLLPNLLNGPLNTKYPSKPFYWSPSDGVSVIYDNTTTIPGKPQHLQSYMFIDRTWQKGPGLVEYTDEIGRGGRISSIGRDIKYGKNWHMTLIWQPEGRFSGKELPLDTDNPENYLELDIIHTLFWNQ
jgi:hypothetical protein